MEDSKYYIQKKTGRRVSSSQQIKLNRVELAAIAGNPDVIYYGTITIPGTSDIVKLNYDDDDAIDETTFDNTDAIGSGAMAGTFRDVLFNKTVTMNAALGEVFFTGVKATLE